MRRTSQYKFDVNCMIINVRRTSLALGFFHKALLLLETVCSEKLNLLERTLNGKVRHFVH